LRWSKEVWLVMCEPAELRLAQPSSSAQASTALRSRLTSLVSLFSSLALMRLTAGAAVASSFGAGRPICSR
jgi:hypothetical protein